MGNTDKLNTSVQYLKGVGPRLAKVLARLDIYIIKDLLHYFPRAYDDRTHIPKIAELKINEVQMVLGEIISLTEEKKGRLSIIKAIIEQDGRHLALVWFNQPFLMKVLKGAERDSACLEVNNPGIADEEKDELGSSPRLFARGKVELNRYTRELQMSVQEFEIIEDIKSSLCLGRVVPTYGLTEGLSQKKMRQIAASVIENFLPLLEDLFPAEYIKKYRLIPLHQAISSFHYPEGRAEWKQAHDRLVFDEFFLFYIRLFSVRDDLVKEEGISFDLAGELYGKYLQALPFILTGAQQRVIDEIRRDMQKPHVMNRLVQGDVGSGKTEVAIAAILTAVENGYQAAVMAPTEILAEQHYNKMITAFRQLGIECRLVVSGLKSQEKKDALHAIKHGDVQVAIGTHALIQDQVEFHKMGLVVIDEQHRFGVKQREALKQKGANPDFLVMTATPIPRTLALTVYGDLDKSIIDEMPPGRKPVKTSFNPQTTKLYSFIRQQVQLGRQAYIVYPLVEETEKSDLKAATESAEHLQRSVFPDLKIGLVHGKLKKEEKESVIHQFRNGDIHILVSTTVIEVGVDVPNASIMVIEEAERFGLSQLHQLRGRVGRGREYSHCFLMGRPKTEDAWKRLKAMQNTSNGFEIAEYDLQIRGPGEFLGTRQSGLPAFKVADLLKDEKVLLKVKAEVELLSFEEREDYLKRLYGEVTRQN
ncbi:MAG: ATP-dependent DNA helicase RecG [Candidatus Margulisiibacteriota bacterium]